MKQNLEADRVRTQLYATFLGRLPRKRKLDIHCIAVDTINDVGAIQGYINERGICQVGTIGFNRYRVTETSFVDFEGITQTIFFKDLFPISCERVAELDDLLDLLRVKPEDQALAMGVEPGDTLGKEVGDI